MATGAEIPAPICGETIMDQVGNIINKLPQEEKNQADAPSEPPTVEGHNFLTPPSIHEVHCHVNNISRDASKVTEKEEISSERIQQNAEETKVTEKTEKSSLIQAREQVEKESEKLQLTEVSNESAVVIDKIKDEDEDIRKAELFENEENTEKEDNKTSCQGIVNDDTEEKTIDAVDTQKEVIEDFPTTVSNEEIEEKPMIKVDDAEVKTAEKLEKASEKTSPLVLEKKASFDQSIVMHERQKEGELKGELCENEENRERVLLKVDSKMEEPKDTLSEASEETSYLLPDEKADEKTVDAAEIKEETSENVASIVSYEKTEDDSLIQVDCPEMKDKGHLDEVNTDDENPTGAELFENEIDGGSALLKEEVQIEKPIESCHAALEEVKTSENPDRILGDEIEEKTIDEAESNEKTEEQQNDETTIPHEHTEEISVIQVDCTQMEQEEHLEKESENTPLEEVQTEKNNGNESENMHEVKDRDAGLIKAELLENEENTGSDSVKEEAELEKPIESLQVVTDEIKACDSSQYTGIIEEQIQTSDPQEISTEIIDGKTIDAAKTKEETLEDIATNPHGVLGDKTEEKTIDSAESNEKTDEQQDTPEDNKGSASSEDIEKTCSLEETKTIDVIDKKEVTHDVQNVETTTPHEHIEENSVIQVDCTQMEHEEHLVNESEIPLGEAQPEKNNDNDSKNMHEVKERDADLIKAELLEEAEVEKPIESLQVVTEDIKACDSSQYTEIIEEQIQTSDPQEIPTEIIEEKTIDAANMKEETLEDIATNVPNGDHEDNPTVEVDGTENPALEIASKGSVNDYESTITHEAELVDESSIKADLSENEKNTEGISVKEETYIKSLPVAAEDIKACASVQDREITCIEEQIPTANPQDIVGDQKEDKTNDDIGLKDETREDKGVPTTIPWVDTEENSLIQEDCSEVKQNEQLEKESENLPLIETPIKENQESTLVMEETHVDIKDTEKSDCTEEQITATEPEKTSCENPEEKNIDAADMKEATVENTATTTPHEGTEDTSIQDDCSQIEQNKHLEKESENQSLPSSIDKKIKTEDPQETPSDKTEEKPIDTTHTKDEIVALQKEIAPNVPNGDDEDNSPIEVDSTEKPSLEKASKGSNDDDAPTITCEAKSVDESSIIADFIENEKTTKGTLVGKVPFESLQEVTEGVKTVVSVYDTEISYSEEQNPIANLQEIEHNHEESKRTDAIDVTEEIPEDKNITPTMPQEDIKEMSQIQVDCSTQVEKPTDSLQVANEDIKLSGSGQDTETRSTKEQILTTDPQEIAGEKTEEKAIDAADSIKPTLENVERTIPHEGTEVDCSQIELNEHLEKESENPYSVEEEAQVGKINDQLQVATEDINACSGAKPETISIEEQIRTVNPHEISSEENEEKPINASHTKDETVDEQGIATNVPNGDNEDNLPTEVNDTEKPSLESARSVDDDVSIITHDATCMDQSSIEADLIKSGKNIEGTLAKDEVPIEPLQEVAEGIETLASVQDRETSSPYELSLTANPQQDVDDHKEIKTNEPDDENVAPTMPQEDAKENSEILVDCPQMEFEEHLDMKEVTIDAASTDKKTLDIQDISANIPSEDDEDNSPIEFKGSTDDDMSTISNEAKFVEESSMKADSFEDEKNTESTTMVKEVPVEPLQEIAEDIKSLAPVQERETSSLEEQSPTVDPQEVVNDHKQNKTIDGAGFEEETLEDKNDATNTPQENTKENSQIQVDCSQMEYKKHLEKENEDPSLTETPTVYIIESTLATEEAQMEKLIDCLQVNIKDAKAFASVQDKETSSIVEQVLTTDSRENSNEITKERATDATATSKETLEVQDIATNAPTVDNEDTSPTKADGTENPSLKIASTGNDNDHESTIIHEVKFEDESSIIANFCEIEKDTEAVFVKEEASSESLQVAAANIEDIKVSASIQDTEISYIDKEIVTEDEQKISGNKIDEKPIDAVDIVETLVVQDIPKDVPNGDDEDNSSINEAGSPKPFLDAEKMVVLDDGSITTSTNENLVETNPKASTEVEAQVPTGENEAQKMQQDTDVGTNKKKIDEKEELSINASHDVSEPNGVNGEEEETRNSDNFKEISDHSNFVAFDDVSSCNLTSEEVSTSITSHESITEIQQKTENEEAQKQYEELHIVGLKDSSLKKIENDVQVCLASAHDSDITPEMQKPEEASIPSSDEKITERVIGEDDNENEVVMQKPKETSLPSSDEKIIEERENEDVDATKIKYIKQLEQDDATKCFVDDQKPTETTQNEAECRQDKVMLDEKVDNIKETTSTSVSNDILPVSSNETSKINDLTTERELAIDSEELCTGETTTGENEEPKVDGDKIKADEASKKQIPDVGPETPDMIEKTDQDVARLPSESPEEICTDKITEECDKSYETTDTGESTSLEDIHINSRSSGDLETKIDNEAQEIETAKKELPVNFTGLHGSDVTELKVTPQSEKDKHVVLEADCSENGIPQNSIGNENISHGVSMECLQDEGECEGEILKPSKPEQEEANCVHEERSSQETTKSVEEYESKDKPSILDLLQVHVKQTSQIAHDSEIEKETTIHKEELHAEKNDEVEHEETKTDEEKDVKEHSSEERKSDLCSEAPVMVEAGETYVKVDHKKLHNLLSGVGSKVKHSIAKVKKAITGKSSHPKPTSPK